MALVRTASLVESAIARGGAVPAFNVILLEHAEAIAAGAPATGAILQVSENAIRFHGGDPTPLLLACRAIAEHAAIPLAIHLDHVEDAGLIDLALRSASAWGLGSIMVDASRHPYSQNVAETADVASRAHDLGLWIEAELGEIGGKDGAHAPGVRTDPAEAAAFAAATGIDLLAVAVGSSHAMRDRSASVDAELVGRLAALVPVPLVLHGSSGVPDDELRRAVAAGMRKVNVGTALNLAASRALRAALDADPNAVDPRRYLAPARAAMAETVAQFAAVIS
jgi:fructose-bisphosphate aldolase, class II